MTEFRTLGTRNRINVIDFIGITPNLSLILTAIESVETSSRERYLILYTKEDWETESRKQRERMRPVSSFLDSPQEGLKDDYREDIQQIVFNNSFLRLPDVYGRICLPRSLMEYAGIKGRVSIVKSPFYPRQLEIRAAQ